MVTYIIQRLFIFFPMLLVISFLVYLGLELAPGDAVSHMISPELASTITAEQLNAMREAYGLNQSFLTRYWLWLTSMVQGDMGYSMAGGVAISEIMAKTIPATLELSIVALIFSTIIGYVVSDFLNKDMLIGLTIVNPIYFICMMIGAMKTVQISLSVVLGVILGPSFYFLSPEWCILFGGIVAGTIAFLFGEKYGK